MTHVTCRLTAKNRHQLRNPTLGNRVWATFFSTRRALLGLTIVTVCQPTLYKVSSDSVAIFKHMAFLCSVYFCFLELILFFYFRALVSVVLRLFLCHVCFIRSHLSNRVQRCGLLLPMSRAQGVRFCMCVGLAIGCT